MAFTVYTGQGMTFSADTHALTGIKKVAIEDVSKPAAEKLDKATAASVAYEYMDDPMGSKGDPKATVVVTCDDSTVGIADTQAHHLTLGGSMAVAFAAGGAGDDKYEHTMHLQKRTTTTPHDAPAQVELTFEELTLGTWGTT